MIHLHQDPKTASIGAAQTLAPRCPASRRLLAGTLLAGALCLAGVSHDAAAVLVSLDTSTLSGTPARLEFVLFDGDSAANNSVTTASVSTDGILTALDCSLGCTGGPPFTLDDASGFGLFLQDLTLGSRVSFELTFTSNFSGSGTSDRLVLSLLDPDTNRTLVDTDLDLAPDPLPFQDALLFVDLAGDTRIEVARRSDPGIPISIPEPGAAALFSLGLALLGGQGIRRRTSSVSGREKTATTGC